MAAGPGGKVYLTSDRHLFRLNQAGNGWEELSLPSNKYPKFVYTNPEGHVYVIEIFGGIYRSTNEGSSFSVAVPDDSTQGWPKHYSFNGNNNNFCVVAYGASWRMYRFDDNGDNVVQIKSGSGIVNSIFYHPSGIFYFSDNKFSRSYDNGDSWEQSEIMPGETYQPRINLMDIYHTGEMIAATWSGMFISSDEGGTWQLMDDPLGSLTGYVVQYANDGYNLFFSGNSCGSQTLLQSKNGGQTWNRLEGNFLFSNVFKIYKDKNQNLYARNCRYPTLERSQDGGNTWAPYYIPGVDLPVVDVKENSSGQLFVLTTGAFYRFDEGNNTWENITPTTSFWLNYQLSISPQDVLFLTSDFEFLRSVDDGDTWENINLPSFELPIIQFHPNGDVYATTGSFFKGISRSGDGGQTWEEVFPDTMEIYNLHINSKGHIYFLGNDLFGNTGGLYASYDNFASYDLIYPNAYFNAMESDIEGTLYLPLSEGIQYSEDDGLTWNEFNQGLPDRPFTNTIYIDKEQYLYLGINNDVIYKTAEPVAESNLVFGNIWFDKNGNCQKDDDEIPLTNWLVEAASGGSQYYRSTGTDGSFIMALPTGDHALDVVLPNNLWASDCLAGANISFPGNMDTAYVDFPIAAAYDCPLMEVDISAPLLRRCFSNDYTVRYCNTGTALAEAATVEVTLDPFFIYNSATAPLLSQNGDVYTFSIGDVGVGKCGSFKINIEVSCESELGQEHCVDAHIFPDSCNNVLPHSETLECQPNIGSFDPNDKTAFVAGHIESEWVKANTDIEYKIRFQNTGTDTAFTVVVQDQLSTLLDPATLRPGASSHPYQFEMMEPGMVRFIFHDIMLPDSNINEAASHGFVKFTVSQKNGLPDGEKITNTANIFFDFNDPVPTNLVELTVGEPTAANEQKQAFGSRAFPNPFHKTTLIEVNGLDGTALQFQLFDNTGLLHQTDYFTAPYHQLKVAGLPSGMYFYLIKKEGERVAFGKLVVQ